MTHCRAASQKRSLIERLGYSPTDRVLIVHADDVGLCHASVQAYEALTKRGYISSASVMTTSSWFPATARTLSALGQHDVGVHLTLNSEWPGYKLRPLIGSAASSLCDSSGYFHALAAQTVKAFDAQQAILELEAQINIAVQVGIELTHIDSHMLTLLHTSLLPHYLALSQKYCLPSAVVRLSPAQVMQLCKLSAAESEALAAQIHDADGDGLVCLDAWEAFPLDRSEGRLEYARRLLDSLPEGLSMLVFHPAFDNPELRAIASDWSARVADATLLAQDDWQRLLESKGIHVIGMREVRDAMFGSAERPVLL